MERTIEQKKVTYDFERLMEGATKVKTSEFASYIIENMDAARTGVDESSDSAIESFADWT